MMNSIKKLLAASLALAASIYASERVYLAPFNMVGLNPDFGVAAEKLMNAYAEDDGRFILINHAVEDSVKGDDRTAINQKAIEKNCTKFIMAEFTRLGENVITSFKLYDINNESAVWSDRLKAKNPDDFDPIIQRVARNIGTKNKATNDDDIYTVTEQETKKPKRKGVTTYYGLNIIGNLALAPEADMAAGLGFFMFYDARNLFFSLDMAISNMGEDKEKPTMFDIALSIYYPFGTSNITPFVGGGLAYSWRTTYSEYDSYDGYYYYSDSDELNANGLSADIGGGVMFNRASRISFILQAKYFFDFFSTPHIESKSIGNNKIEYQRKSSHIHGFKFSLGLGF